MPGRVVIQWDKEDCADLGIIKVDLLGLGMMAVLKDSIDLIGWHYGEAVDLAHLPPNDPVVYDTLVKADTVGIFQVESRAQMACLPRLRPRCFYDLVVQVAIIRPGPIVGKMVNPYLKRRQGRETVDYLHPSLRPVLERTLGVPLFQEQLLRMAMIAAGFSGGEAEELRRALGFKRSEKRMREVETKLRRGMNRQGITGAVQDRIVQSITSFALYGFPESHAASFALIAYASAWLKCHYPAAFTAAMLNNQPMGFYSAATLVKDAQLHGLKFRPIDVQRSEWACTLEPLEASAAAAQAVGRPAGGPYAVRLGFCYAKGLRECVARDLVRERALAAFRSVQDLKRRLPAITKKELVGLAEIGALNSLGPGAGGHRRSALWTVERAARPAGPLLEESELQAPSLAGNSTLPLAPMTPPERLTADFRGTGLTIGPHPMRLYRAEMNALGVTPARRLHALPHGRHVRVAGGVIARQRPGTAKGFVFLSLEDETGICNVIIAPDLFEQNRVPIITQQFLLVDGMLQILDGVVSIKAQQVHPLGVSAAPSHSHDFH
jgi:error-prone DNA polymerase